jgi:hypothetical protein
MGAAPTGVSVGPCFDCVNAASEREAFANRQHDDGPWSCMLNVNTMYHYSPAIWGCDGSRCDTEQSRQL